MYELKCESNQELKRGINISWSDFYQKFTYNNNIHMKKKILFILEVSS